MMSRRQFKHIEPARAAVLRAMAESAYVEATPLPDGWTEVAVKADRAAILPAANGKSCIDPEAANGARA